MESSSKRPVAADVKTAIAWLGQEFKLIESAATGERNFVKKAVNMALRSIGKRSREKQRE